MDVMTALIMTWIVPASIVIPIKPDKQNHSAREIHNLGSWLFTNYEHGNSKHETDCNSFFSHCIVLLRFEYLGNKAVINRAGK